MDGQYYNHHMEEEADPEQKVMPVCPRLTSEGGGELPHCAYCCHCGLKLDHSDPLARKREKRKQYKKRLKAKHKAEQEQALRDMEGVVKSVYARKVGFVDVEAQVLRCLAVDTNQEKFYEFINSVIRDEVEVIRKQISNYLIILPTMRPPKEHELIKRIFNQVRRVKEASPIIQRILNMFVSRHFGSSPEDHPFQKNLDQMTYSFLVKNYLQRTSTSVDMEEHFVHLCERIFEHEQYDEERHLFQQMMKAYNTLQPQDAIDDEDEDYDPDDYDDEEEWEEESTRDSIQSEMVSEPVESRSRRRKNRKKRLKQQYDSAEQQCEAMIKRMEAMTIRPEELKCCNVTEEWLHTLTQRRCKYRKG